MAIIQTFQHINNQDSPDIDEIINIIRKGSYPAIVYSKFLDKGVSKVAVKLEKDDIPHAIISGMTSHDKLRLIVDNYNNGKYQVLLTTPAGVGRISLNNTRQIHIMESDDANSDHIISMAIRYQSHMSLSAEDRVVDIHYWKSTVNIM